jgi:ABC-type amino acid transport substrate-binding protein
MASASTFAHADQLDDIISAGKLRCAVELDFPPNGARDKDNKPIGFDVDYCNDLAKALGVVFRQFCPAALISASRSHPTLLSAPRPSASRSRISSLRPSFWLAKIPASRARPT